MANRVDNKFTWIISNFSSLPPEAIYSDHFIVGGCKWGLIKYDELLLFLQVNDHASLLPEWRRLARFSVTIVNQNPEKSFKVDDRQSWFDKCSFRRSQPFVPLSEFKPKDGGFLVNDELKIVAEVEVLEVVGKLDVTEEPKAATRPLKKTKLNVPQAATQPLKKTKLNDGGAKLNDGGAVSRDLFKETVDVNGFHVLPSQVDAVRRIFEKHPDIALGFRANNQHLRTACVNVLLSLTEILRQLPQEISKDDLAYAYVLLGSLKDAGLKVDWLEKKVNEVSEKKEKERACETRMLEIKKELEDLKAEVSDARAPLTLDDVV